MASLAAAIVALLNQLLPLIGGGSTLIDSIIATLAALIPLLITEAQDLLPEAQNIIAILKGNENVTPAQMQALAGLDAQIDAAFEAAAAAAGDPESTGT